jgi:hypothetical protein
MSECIEMKVGEVYACPICNIELQVVKECCEGDSPTCDDEECSMTCCGTELTKKTC